MSHSRAPEPVRNCVKGAGDFEEEVQRVAGSATSLKEGGGLKKSGGRQHVASASLFVQGGDDCSCIPSRRKETENWGKRFEPRGSMARFVYSGGSAMMTELFSFWNARRRVGQAIRKR